LSKSVLAQRSALAFPFGAQAEAQREILLEKDIAVKIKYIS
jgi:hypothetical protein